MRPADSCHPAPPERRQPDVHSRQPDTRRKAELHTRYRDADYRADLPPVRNQNRSEDNTSDLLKVHGAPDTIRTYDTRFRRAVLYPLSYGGIAITRRPRSLRNNIDAA